MKRYILVALVLVGMNAFFTSARAADACPNLFLTNATGSPRVVQGTTVTYGINGIAPSATAYLDGSVAVQTWDLFTPSGQWFFAQAGIGNLPYGPHTLRNSLESCTVNFTVVPVPSTVTLTQGWTYWQDGDGPEATITHLFGFQKNYFGAMSPAIAAVGKPYEALMDMQTCSYMGCTIGGSLTISGFSSDPGKAWLNSVTANGNTKPASDSYYWFSNGAATWSWGEAFGFGAGGTTTVAVSHN